MEHETDGESFSELERRYLLTLILTEEVSDAGRVEELDSIAGRIDDGDEKAEDLYERFEHSILARCEERFESGKLTPLPYENGKLSTINRRMELCYFLNKLHEDPEGVERIEQLSRETHSLFQEDPALAIRRADERLTSHEEGLITLYLDVDDEEELPGDFPGII